MVCMVGTDTHYILTKLNELCVCNEFYQRSETVTRQPLFQQCSMVPVDFNHTICNNPSRTPANRTDLSTDRLCITSYFPHLSVYQRFIESFYGVHRHVIGCCSLYLEWSARLHHRMGRCTESPKQTSKRVHCALEYKKGLLKIIILARWKLYVGSDVRSECRTGTPSEVLSSVFG